MTEKRIFIGDLEEGTRFKIPISAFISTDSTQEVEAIKQGMKGVTLAYIPALEVTVLLPPHFVEIIKESP